MLDSKSTRTELLTPLFAKNSALIKVGSATVQRLAKLCGERVIDLLWHLPRKTIDRQLEPDLVVATKKSMLQNCSVTLKLSVLHHRPPVARKQPWKIICGDTSGFATLPFFGRFAAKFTYLETNYPSGSEVMVYGVLGEFYGERGFKNFDLVKVSEAAEFLGLQPVYSLTSGINQKQMRKLVQQCLARAPNLPEWISQERLAENNWLGWRDSLTALHNPKDLPRDLSGELSPTADSPAHRRLAYDEFLAQQLAFAVTSAWQKSRPSRAIVGDGSLVDRIIANLPFTLTVAQTRAISEIRADLARPHRMQRLLQGDVGSGKTVVALMAMAIVAEAGLQAALIAPTELLARQHGATLARLTETAGLRIVTLTARDSGSQRAMILAEIASGAAQIIVGTHSLLSEKVAFFDLGLAVIDEQHRFGVEQRLILAEKGGASGSAPMGLIEERPRQKHPLDLLLMTATPIPRSLALAGYGDMDMSVLDEKPAGRQAIITRAIPLERIDEVVAAVGRALARNAQVYWVCPQISESDDIEELEYPVKSELAAVESRYDALKQQFGQSVAMLHGKMKETERDHIMAEFIRGNFSLLIATTVIEVGVDVPNASVMVIENAERFGLAQLHQLRGRVGRGATQSSCLLLYQAPLSDIGEARLRTIRDSQDGFYIAEQDLRLRGAGEILGTRQSGVTEFKLADLSFHRDLIDIARSDAQAILASNPRLEGQSGAALCTLLYLFEHNSSIKFLSAG